jgi:hypothetical protein
VFAFGEKGAKTRRPSCERHFLQSALRERFAQLPANCNDFPKIAGWGSLHFRLSGGEEGIRTLGTLASAAVYETAALSHSTTSAEKPRKASQHNRFVGYFTPVPGRDGECMEPPRCRSFGVTGFASLSH